MSIVNNANGTSAVYVDTAVGAGATDTMSPDALLAYCQMQLGSIDDETSQQIQGQQLQLQQRAAVQNAATTLQGFGTDGPSTVGDYNTCVSAYDKAIAGLPSGDPVAEKLATQETQFKSRYGNGEALLPPTMGGIIPPADSTTPLLTRPTSADWQSMTGTLSNLSDNIKSDSEIQMLQLQDLVSERQQAVEQMTGMMTKEDQTLEDGAKAIGQ